MKNLKVMLIIAALATVTFTSCEKKGDKAYDYIICNEKKTKLLEEENERYIEFFEKITNQSSLNTEQIRHDREVEKILNRDCDKYLD